MATIAITGANRGIGLSLAGYYAGRGQNVIAICRRSSPALDNLNVRVESGIDVARDADTSALESRMANVEIDVLVANAGILHADDLDHIDPTKVCEQLQVNALGPLQTVCALLSNLRRGAKVALMTSRMGSIADNTSGGSYGYRMSKAALNAAGASLALDLRPRGVAVAILHPGYVRTDMTGGHGNVDADEAARMLATRIDALTIDNTGTFWHANGEVLPW